MTKHIAFVTFYQKLNRLEKAWDAGLCDETGFRSTLDALLDKLRMPDLLAFLAARPCKDVEDVP